MTVPVIVPRAEHAISRSQIDADALKVLYRLHQNDYVAYLVGGSVRDLLLGRRPKDFDIGTSAHPYQVKRLFRNCWIIGRRFRLAHVKFGAKTIEVATFRRPVSAEELAAAEAQLEGIPLETAAQRTRPIASFIATTRSARRRRTLSAATSRSTRSSTTSPRSRSSTTRVGSTTCGRASSGRSATRSIASRKIRSACCAPWRWRLASTSRSTRRSSEAIRAHRADIARAAPARLMEEFYKLLRTGAGERAFRMLAERRLLEPIAPDLQKGAAEALWRSLAAVDAYRCRFEAPPETLTNAILLGSLLVPLGHTARSLAPPPVPDGEFTKEPRISLGMLPLARRDVERLRQILGLQRRLMDMHLSPRARRTLMHRGPFKEALTWLEIHGDAPDVLEHWRGFIEAAGAFEAEFADTADPQRRRRRRRRRRRPFKPSTAT